MSNKIQTLGGYIHEYQKSVQQPEAFWSRIAESFYWRQQWDEVVDWNFEEPRVNWFVNGKLNITENML
ncbi:MAG: acetyl-coenzyme A synthetase N-terminal domain-containing protein, partial [Tunicatimonas sp.]